VRPAGARLTASDTAPVTGTVARRFLVRGLVQGVGFRPFVYRLARRYGLVGWVRNASGEVEIAVEGPAEHLVAFRQALEAEAPPLARIASIEEVPTETSGTGDFRILESAADPDRRQPNAIGFLAPTMTVVEGTWRPHLSLVRHQTGDSAVVRLESADGTATAGDDYSHVHTDNEYGFYYK